MPTLLPSEMRKKASLVLEREVTGILPRIVSATGSAHQQAPSTDVSTHTSRMLSLQLLLHMTGKAIKHTVISCGEDYAQGQLN